MVLFFDRALLFFLLCDVIASRLIDSPLCHGVVYCLLFTGLAMCPIPTPREMSEGHLQYVKDAFVAATKRTASAGCEYRKQLRPC